MTNSTRVRKRTASAFKHIGRMSLGLSFFQMTFFCAQGQSIINKRVEGMVARHTITSLEFLRPDKYNIAVSGQLGVIGNNYFGEQMLTNSKNDNDWEKSMTPTDYFTVNRPGPKMTLCGKVIQYGLSSGYIDDDLNIQIVSNPKATVFDASYTQIKGRGRNAYPWAMIEGEIDIDKSHHKYFTAQENRLPKINATDICLYGPWIEEVYDASEDINPSKDHTDVHEIHPAEQFWWLEKKGSAEFDYLLNAAIDASGRFEESGWIRSPMNNVFAIAFDINLKVREKGIYFIKKISTLNVDPHESDGRRHYLIYGRDTLLQVIEPDTDLMSISFDEVGLDPYAAANRGDSVIKGFILMQSIVKNKGNLKFVVNKKLYRPLKFGQIQAMNISLTATTVTPPTDRPKRVKVTLKEITTLENYLARPSSMATVGYPAAVRNSYFDLTGYIFAAKLSEPKEFSEPTKDILDKGPQLLFPNSAARNKRVIIHSFNNSRTSLYNNSVILTLMPDESINILSDFEAQYQGSFIRTLDLSKNKCYEMQTHLSELQLNRPLLKELILENTETDPQADPKRYKMRIRFEFLLID
jgi:hypothetical protein